MVSWASSPRFFLLLLVLAGVAGMHTIGHPVYVGHSPNGHHESATHVASPIAQPGDDSAASREGAYREAAYHEGAFREAASREAGAHDHGMVMNPMNVCIAVLVGGILLLFSTAMPRLRRSDCADEGDQPAPGGTGRGPPVFALLGLTIADLSVQRT